MGYPSECNITVTFEMASKMVFSRFSDKMDSDLEILQKQISEYTEPFKLEPNKRIWPEGCTRLGKSTFRKRLAHYEYDAGTGVFFRK